jgi:hypothetical protein
MLPGSFMIGSRKLLLVLAFGASLPGSAFAAIDCPTEEAALVKDESELPRLEVASPADRPIICITIETIIAFADRLAGHVAHCPNSVHAPVGVHWKQVRADLSKRFKTRRCRRTF